MTFNNLASDRWWLKMCEQWQRCGGWLAARYASSTRHLETLAPGIDCESASLKYWVVQVFMFQLNLQHVCVFLVNAVCAHRRIHLIPKELRDLCIWLKTWARPFHWLSSWLRRIVSWPDSVGSRWSVGVRLIGCRGTGGWFDQANTWKVVVIGKARCVCI